MDVRAWSVRASMLALISSLSNPVAAENLYEIFQIALQNDPTYLSEVAKQTAALQATPSALAEMLPQLTLSHTITREHQGLAGTGNNLPPANPHVQSYQVSLSQSIFSLEQWAGLKSASYQVKSAKSSLEAAIQDLMFRVSRAYFDVLIAQDNYNFSITENGFISKQLDQTKRRFEVGMIPITDYNDSRARFDNSASRVIDNKNKINDAKQKLMEITGVPVDVNALDLQMPMVKPEPLDESLWVRTALDNNLKIKASDLSAKSAKQIVNRRRAGHLPTIDMTGAVTRGNSSVQDSNHTSRTLNLNFSIPIFQGGGIYSQTRAAQATYERSLQDAEKDRRTAISQVHQSYQGMLTQVERAQALSKAINSNKSSLNATRAAYEIGARTISDVFEAQSNLFASQRDLLNARYQNILLSLQLKLGAGQLQPQDLAQISLWLPENSASNITTQEVS